MVFYEVCLPPVLSSRVFVVLKWPNNLLPFNLNRTLIVIFRGRTDFISITLWSLLSTKQRTKCVCASPRCVIKAIQGYFLPLSCLKYRIHVSSYLKDSIAHKFSITHMDPHFGTIWLLLGTKWRSRYVFAMSRCVIEFIWGGSINHLITSDIKFTRSRVKRYNYKSIFEVARIVIYGVLSIQSGQNGAPLVLHWTALMPSCSASIKGYFGRARY